jgi:spore germination protein GerM
VAVYWLQNKAEKIAFAPPAKLQLSEPSTPPAEQLRTAVERLLQGPANADVFTTIPEGTKLNALSVKPDGVHVDLTKQFAEGGGSASMQGRLGQLIYTASSHDPKQSVWISIDGEPLTVLGGEGLEVSQPMTRQEFEAEFSL